MPRKRDEHMNETDGTPRNVVAALCALFQEQRCMLAVERYFSPDYIEHNPDIPGGNLEGFKQLLVREGLDEPRGHPMKLDVLRIIADGDDVAVHLRVRQLDQPDLMIMELYRVCDGKVVEHWDVMQTAPTDPVNTVHAMS